MKFTEKIPTEPGWYWLKQTSKSEALIVRLSEEEGEWYFRPWGIDWDLFMEQSLGCLWGDRIPEPEVEE